MSPVRWLQAGDRVACERGATVVCIALYGGHEHFVECLRSALAHTPTEVPILVCDDASPDRRSAAFVSKLEQAGSVAHELLYLRRERNLGFPANVNAAFAACAPADMVVLNSDCVVAEGWLQGLREAAYSDSRVATATPLSNNGTIVSVPDPGRPRPDLPPEWSFEAAAAAVRDRSLRIRPRLPTAIGHCVFVRRSAIELVGDFDEAFSPGYGEEVDFSQRCLRAGLCHVLADEVLVLHRGRGSFGAAADEVQAAHERELVARYPYYHDGVRIVQEDLAGPLARALGAARRALEGLSVVIDGRVLAGPMTGTHVHVLELVAALAREGAAHVRLLVPHDLSADAARALEPLREVELEGVEHALDRGMRADIAHRPYQVSSEGDLELLRALGERVVVTTQDLIGYHNPAYFADASAWEGYRRLTRLALALADRVVFPSEHALGDAIAEDLIGRERASVIPIGVDHRTPPPRPPRGADRLPDGVQAILCLGADLRHKNRAFALRVLDRLQRGCGWEGRMLLAGIRAAHGSSTPEEAELEALRPELAEALIDFAAVSEPEKAWLLRRAALVLYPTVHEGFGLVPFEAAQHGVPCMWAGGTALAETLGDGAGGIVAWDAEQTAQRALELLGDEHARRQNVDVIRRAGADLTWQSTARRMLELYERTCSEPSRPLSRLEWDRLLGPRPEEPTEPPLELSEDALRLLGPDRALPEDLERPLLALATHPRLGRPMFGTIRAAYRLSRRLRTLGLGERPGEERG